MSWIDDVTAPLTELGMDAGTGTAVTDGPGAGGDGLDWLAGSGPAMTGGAEAVLG